MTVPIISPAGPLAVRGRSIPGIATILQHFTADQNVTWTKDGGTLSGITSNAVDLTYPNQTGNYHLYGTNGSSQIGTVLIGVESVIPNYWEFQNPISANKNTFEFVPKYGPTQHRIFGDPTAIQYKWELGADDSDQSQYLEIKAFYDFHHPGLNFLLYDPVINETRRYETDSDWSSLYKPGDSYSWKFKIKEIWPFAIVT